MELDNLNVTIGDICQEKGLSKESVLEAIEKALATAYRRDFGTKNQNIEVKLDLVGGTMEVFDVKTVVEDPPEKEDDLEEKEKLESEEEEEGKKRFNPRKEIGISEAKKIKKRVKIGDEIRTKLTVPSDFGRVAAQSAKQVIIQKLREAEREVIFKEFKEKEGNIFSGVVQRKERGNLLIDLGKATAILPFYEQIESENYSSGQRIKFYLLEVRETNRGPEIIGSRAHAKFLEEIFKSEIPEIGNGTVEIKAIAREAGARSKVAVATKEKGLDPIGTCIGQRGSRIQTVIAEIGGEKIDIIEYSDNPAKFIISALAPAKIASINIIDQENKIAKVRVKPDQLSLAIGRAGQNVRLAAKLTGWKIEVEKDEDEQGEKVEEEENKEEKNKKAENQLDQ